MAKTRKRTPKERVLARYPAAYSLEYVDGHFAITPHSSAFRWLSDSCHTARQAWADAARRLQQEKGK